MSKNNESDTPFIEPWIDFSGWDEVDFSGLETPCYVVSERKLEENMQKLEYVQKTSGCKILMAKKYVFRHQILHVPNVLHLQNLLPNHANIFSSAGIH